MESLKRVDELLGSLVSYQKRRKENRQRLQKLYEELGIDEKVGDFERLFRFNAINLTGLWLQEERFAQRQPKRYVQIIAITKEEGRSHNLNLKYFGRSDLLQEELVEKICEFVVRWRFEKAFEHLEYYNGLVKRFDT